MLRNYLAMAAGMEEPPAQSYFPELGFGVNGTTNLTGTVHTVPLIYGVLNNVNISNCVSLPLSRQGIIRVRGSQNAAATSATEAEVMALTNRGNRDKISAIRRALQYELADIDDVMVLDLGGELGEKGIIKMLATKACRILDIVFEGDEQKMRRFLNCAIIRLEKLKAANTLMENIL